jgi:1A family penicillin-binding protein
VPIIARFSKMSRRRKIVLLAWSGGSTLILLALFTTVYFANTLGSKERIMNRNKTGVTLLDQNDKVFYTFYNAHSNTYVPLKNIAESAKKAVVASEDKDFYNHAGFSPKGIANALWQNIKPGGLGNGGSTITQQLVKTALLSEQRSYIRKYQELVLSIEIERRYTKDEILEMYLNSVYFGEGAFGIEDASKIYFGKTAAELNTAEASLLIGLLPAPSAYSPISGDRAKAQTRQTYVLGRMKEGAMITSDEASAAAATPLTYVGKKPELELKAPHFALMVKSELEKRYGEEKIARSGYSVKTSLNLDWQTIAETAVANQVNKLARSNVSNGSAVVIDPKTGEVRALVGSKDWNNEVFGKFNIATATRQPGSSFKPIVYGAGIENKVFSAATIFEDKATSFNGYAPNNYDLRYRGDVTLRRALANSLNIPAVEALQKTGIAQTVKTAEQLGITTLGDKNYNLTMALGTAPANLTEMTNAYATYANGGKHNDSTLITTITDKDKKTIYRAQPKNNRAISAQTSYIISSILSDNTARSELFGSSLNLTKGRVAAVKTGTTENYRDAWTIGYTPSIAVGVWIGNNDEAAMSRVAGSSGAAPIWKNIMQTILANSPVETFTIPSGLTQRSVCRSSGALAQTTGSNTLTEYFIPGTLPTKTCNAAKKVEQAPVIKQEERDDSQTQRTTNSTDTSAGDNPNNGNGNGNGNGTNQGNSGNSTPSSNPNGGSGNQPNTSLPNTP